MADGLGGPDDAGRRRRGIFGRLWENLASFGLDRDGQGLRFWELLSIAGFAIGMAIIALYAHDAPSFYMTFGVLAAVGCASWLAGGVLGFLFGVPRLRAATPQNTAATSVNTFVPNTNLEQISDWLTKIIVGAALVQLKAIADDVNLLAIAIGQALGTPGAAVIGGGVMVLYFCGGFMWGYLWCSLRVFQEMSALTSREQAVTRHEQRVVAGPSQ